MRPLTTHLVRVVKFEISQGIWPSALYNMQNVRFVINCRTGAWGVEGGDGKDADDVQKDGYVSLSNVKLCFCRLIMLNLWATCNILPPASFQEEVKDAQVDRNEVAQELLLEHLAAEGAGPVVAGFGQDGGNNGAAAEADTSITGSARRLIACNMLLERCKDVERQQKDQLEGVKVEDSILRYRQIYERQRSCLGPSTFGGFRIPLGYRQALACGEAVMLPSLRRQGYCE